MDNYAERQKERQEAFTKELNELLLKYNADMEVNVEIRSYASSRTSLEVVLHDIQDGKGETIEPYCFFELPTYMDGK